MLLHVVTVALIALTLASAGVWVVSYSRAAGVAIRTSNGAIMVWENWGGVAIIQSEQRPSRGFDASTQAAFEWDPWLATFPRANYRGRAGFHWLAFPRFSKMVVIPFWFLTLMLSTAAAIAMWREIVTHKTRRRARAGLCPACGYDMRATPDRCPECGRKAPVKEIAAAVAG